MSIMMTYTQADFERDRERERIASVSATALAEPFVLTCARDSVDIDAYRDDKKRATERSEREWISAVVQSAWKSRDEFITWRVGRLLNPPKDSPALTVDQQNQQIINQVNQDVARKYGVSVETVERAVAMCNK